MKHKKSKACEKPANHRTIVAAERRKKTRAKLLKGALRVFARRGAEAKVIDSVIKKAGVSRGTFYNYFRTNEELFVEVAREVSNEIIRAVDPLVERQEKCRCGHCLRPRLGPRTGQGVSGLFKFRGTGGASCHQCGKPGDRIRTARYKSRHCLRPVHRHRRKACVRLDSRSCNHGFSHGGQRERIGKLFKTTCPSRFAVVGRRWESGPELRDKGFRRYRNPRGLFAAHQGSEPVVWKHQQKGKNMKDCDKPGSSVSRRDFLRLAGAGVTALGLGTIDGISRAASTAPGESPSTKDGDAQHGSVQHPLHSHGPGTFLSTRRIAFRIQPAGPRAIDETGNDFSESPDQLVRMHAVPFGAVYRAAYSAHAHVRQHQLSLDRQHVVRNSHRGRHAASSWLLHRIQGQVASEHRISRPSTHLARLRKYSPRKWRTTASPTISG